MTVPAHEGDQPTREGDHTARRRAAETAAQAAEARATAAAADAKAAIAAAARAAAMADAAAQEAERAEVAVRAAAQAETRAAADAARRAALRAPRPAPAPRVSVEDIHARDDTARHRPGSAPSRAQDETDELTEVPPSPNGRAARRRAAAAETAVFAPVTDSGPVTALTPAVRADPEPADPEPADDAPTRATPPRAVPARAEAGEPPTRATRRARRRRGLLRRPAPPVLAAAAAGGVLALAGVLFAGNAVRTTLEPAAMVESAAPSAEPVVPVLPDAAAGRDAGDGGESLTDTTVDPLEDRSVTFLQELRAAGVPTSRGGLAETEAADLVCTELSDGVDEARIARALPATLPTVSRAQAADLVDIARDSYCD